jgi:hypothetical protein
MLTFIATNRSLRAKRSNLVPTMRDRVEIASSPALAMTAKVVAHRIPADLVQR